MNIKAKKMFDALLDFAERNLYEFLEFWTPVIMISVGSVVFVLETGLGMRAAYGRYNTKNSGLSAPIAWLIQESPAFIIPFSFMFYRSAFLFDRQNKSINSNFILLFYFMMHYFNRYTTINRSSISRSIKFAVSFILRSFIYTRRIKSNKKVNYLENILAFCFCVTNGIQIGHFHTIRTSNSLFTWNFILGDQNSLMKF